MDLKYLQAPPGDLAEVIRAIPSSLDLPHTKIQLTLHSNALVVTVVGREGDKERSARIRFGDTHPSFFEARLTSILDALEPELASTEVELTCASINFMHLNLGPSLWKLPSLQKITVLGSCHHADHLLRHLTPPRDFDGIYRWPCSSLKFISFLQETDCSLKTLVTMLESRGGELYRRDPAGQLLPQESVRFSLPSPRYEVFQAAADSMIARGRDSGGDRDVAGDGQLEAENGEDDPEGEIETEDV